VTFLAPLWLLLLVLSTLPFLLPVRDRRHAALRSAAIALVALALARPVLHGRGGAEHHALVVDTSRSVASAATDTEALADGITRALPGRARVHRIDVAGDASSLSAALAAAGRAIPVGERGAVTLVTDGLSTDRRHGPAVAALSARGVPVHVVALAPDEQPLRPVGLSADGELRVGHTARLRVVLAGTGAADVRLDGPAGTLVTEEGVEVDGRREIVLEMEPREAGYLPVTVRVGDDEPPLARTLAVQEPLRVLHVGGRVRDGGPRLATLLGPGFDVTEAPGGDATELPDVTGHDVVMLDDRPADTVPDTWQQQVVRAVTDRGMGLVMAGGGGSFGPGGWHETTIASALPVECAQKEEKRDPSTTLAIIIDTSGSMSGGRVQLAKEVARLAMRRLLPHDKVGIVEFYGTKRWAAPIQPASNRIELQRALNRLNAGGGTVILPAIEEAYYGMQNVQTRYKHVLVLTDGGVERGAFEPLIRKMADEGMNVSTVLIGPDAHSEFLVNIANWGKGRFYSVPNRFNLPELLLKQPTTARLPAYRPGTYRVRARGGSGWWGGVDPSDAPALSGYVETRSRDGALVLMETEGAGHPVLATWRHGLGRVTAFTSEPVGPGTQSWTGWDDYGRALARVLERTSRDHDADMTFAIDRQDDVITVTARRNAPGDLRPSAVVTRGVDPVRELRFEELADGLFRSRLHVDPALEVRVTARVAGSEDVTRLVSSAHEDVAPETQVDPARAIDLPRVAAATGGDVVAPADAESFRPRVGGGDAPRDVHELRTLLLVLALLTYLADVLHRRLPEEAAA
jgi:uncharacterized membrane protein